MCTGKNTVQFWGFVIQACWRVNLGKKSQNDQTSKNGWCDDGLKLGKKYCGPIGTPNIPK